MASARRVMTDAAPAPAARGGASGHDSSSGGMRIMVGVLVTVIVCTMLYCVYCWRWRKRNAIRRSLIESLWPRSSSDLPLMDLASILAATDNFSKANKLGEGGFGPVYRGALSGGAEIAVKRLSARSRQGAAEFRNEVELIAKLQHRNLVRLLGWCADRDEKLLVYEYLPNRSLDAFIFEIIRESHLNVLWLKHICLFYNRGKWSIQPAVKIQCILRQEESLIIAYPSKQYTCFVTLEQGNATSRHQFSSTNRDHIKSSHKDLTGTEGPVLYVARPRQETEVCHCDCERTQLDIQRLRIGLGNATQRAK